MFPIQDTQSTREVPPPLELQGHLSPFIGGDGALDLLFCKFIDDALTDIWQKADDGVYWHYEVVLQTWVVVPSSPVPEYHSQLQLKWSSERGVLFSRRGVSRLSRNWYMSGGMRR